MNKCWLIINPISGSKSNDKKRKQLIEQAKNYCEIHFTEYSGHAKKIALNAINENVSKVIVAGGDGTINEVCQSLINTKIEIGIVPLGSGNGLSIDLGISKKPIKAFNFAISNHSRKIDAIKWNNNIMVNASGMGFDGLIAKLFNEGNNRGIIGYTKYFIMNILTAKPSQFRIEIDQNSWEISAHLVTIANSRQFGNHIIIAPRAIVNDSIGNITIIPGKNAIVTLLKYGYQFFKTIRNENGIESYLHPDFIHLKFKKAIIYNYNLSPTHIDGEPVMPELVNNIELIPLSLNIIY